MRHGNIVIYLHTCSAYIMDMAALLSRIICITYLPAWYCNKNNNNNSSMYPACKIAKHIFYSFHRTTIARSTSIVNLCVSFPIFHGHDTWFWQTLREWFAKGFCQRSFFLILFSVLLFRQNIIILYA